MANEKRKKENTNSAKSVKYPKSLKQSFSFWEKKAPLTNKAKL